MASDTDITIPELPASTGESVNDLFLLTQPNAQSETGYSSAKATMERVAKKILGGIELPTDLPDFPTNQQNPLDALELLKQEILDLYPIVDVSGSIVNFNTSLALPFDKCLVQIDLIQSGSGTPSPQNVRNISGRSSVSIEQAGKNLFDKDNGIILNCYIGDGTIRGSSQAQPKTVCVECEPNTTYTISKNAGTRFTVAYSTSSQIPEVGDVLNGVITNNTASSITITTGANATYLCAYVYTNEYDVGLPEEMINSVMVEKGSQATAYNPYFEPVDVTISLGSTIFGGVLDMNKGILSITKVYYEYDGSEDEAWSKVSGTGKFYITNEDIVNTSNSNKISNIYPFSGVATSSSSVTVDKSFYTQRNQNTPEYNRIWVYDTDYTSSTVAQFKTVLSNQPMQIVADLIEPINVQLTTPTLTAFAGTNIISADSGDVEVSFKQGIQEYIDAKIAETQALVLNS